MSINGIDERRAEAYAALNRAIELLTEDSLPPGHIVTDAVLVVGTESLAADGHRHGGVGFYMKDIIAPVWHAKGLLTDALDALRANASCTCGD